MLLGISGHSKYSPPQRAGCPSYKVLGRKDTRPRCIRVPSGASTFLGMATARLLTYPNVESILRRQQLERGHPLALFLLLQWFRSCAGYLDFPSPGQHCQRNWHTS